MAVKPKIRYSTVTLAELGPQLPIGIESNGQIGKQLSELPWKMKHEKELGAMRAKNQGISVAQFTSMVLATLYKRMGPHDFEPMDFNARRIHISQAFMADVYYAYVWLRRQSIGNVCDMKLRCPNCTNQFDFAADLNTVEVRVPQPVEPVKDDKQPVGLPNMNWTYKLQDPFELRNKTVTELLLGPARWYAMEAVKGQMNTGEAKYAIINGSIHKVGGHDQQLVLADHELDEMSKRDLEQITAEIDANALGPDMSIKDVCPRCNRDFELPIDWGFDSFFGISSR